ncbi:hypothetical protein KVR01_002895 [Diaporthe batatas]|uniref:uncharacterized protein n=1 Tax=Diaporthe batatas TaxID=748121 RepID=UPI001D05279A|nr:uncharacterized protein KVR01_002895 [Diaporthe batatas]KAG8167206.1 hypothetical protein KVR01_002895 [Diaporthe batatas]
MVSSIKAVLLGAALATAAPLADHTTHETTEVCMPISSVFPDGRVPVNMAAVEDPAHELALCKFNYCAPVMTADCHTLAPADCNLAELVNPVIANIMLPAAEHNTTIVPLCERGDITFPPDHSHPLDPKLGEQPDKTEPAALEPRDKSECPAKCAPWAVLPPFGLWFATCIADCHLRCIRGLSCP